MLRVKNEFTTNVIVLMLNCLVGLGSNNFIALNDRLFTFCEVYTKNLFERDKCTTYVPKVLMVKKCVGYLERGKNQSK